MKILSIAPTRISLFGGGTDVSPYCDLYGGLCINMAINLRQSVTLYSEDDIWECKSLVGKNQFPAHADPNFYYKILDYYGINGGHHSALVSTFDGIIESGLGSSASAAVALLGAINWRLDLKLTLPMLAEKAWDLEVNEIGLFGGKQDQYAAAYGGVNAMEFSKDKVTVTPLAKGFIEPLLPSLVLFYTGNNRKSAVIQEGLKDLSSGQVRSLNGIKKLALSAIEPIANGKFKKVGELLDQTWELKKLSNEGVTNARIDEIYTKAKKLGAYGGKCCGAGGGGFMLFVVDPIKKEEFIQKMQTEGLRYWDFSVCWNGLETRVLQ